MKPYDRINWKIVTKALLAFLAFGVVCFLLGRPLHAFGNWIAGISDYLGFAFCNPTLWFLGLDELMWENPIENFGRVLKHGKHGKAEGLVFLCILSGIIHVAILGFGTHGGYRLWQRLDKKK